MENSWEDANSLSSSRHQSQISKKKKKKKWKCKHNLVSSKRFKLSYFFPAAFGSQLDEGRCGAAGDQAWAAEQRWLGRPAGSERWIITSAPPRCFTAVSLWNKLLRPLTSDWQDRCLINKWLILKENNSRKDFVLKLKKSTHCIRLFFF